jgi:hypothetical protein
MQSCAKESKSGCKIVSTVADVCVALVKSTSEHLYKVGGPTGAKNFAEDSSMVACRRTGGKSCKVATSFCADGQQHELKGNTVFSNGNPIFVPQGQEPAAFGRCR